MTKPSAETVPDALVRRAYFVPARERHEAWDGNRWRVRKPGEMLFGEVPVSDVWLVLRVADDWARATKRWRWTGSEWTRDPEAVAKWFVPELVQIEDTVEAWTGLFAALSDHPDWCLVRGVLARGAMTGAPVRRCLKADPKDGGAWIGPHPIGRRVLLVDLDGVDAADMGWPDWPGIHRVPTSEEAEAFVRRRIVWTLPARFWGAAVAYRWSASTGVPGGKRGPSGWARPSCHVAIMLDRPVGDESLHAWIKKDVPRADPCLAGAVHQTYLATPVFVGAPSPWPDHIQRVGLLPGHPTTEAPAALVTHDAWQEAKDRADAEAEAEAACRRWRARMDALAAAPRGGNAEPEKRRQEAYAARMLEGMASDVIGAGKGARHDALRGAATRAGSFVATGILNEALVWDALTSAWATATHGEGREAEGHDLIRSGLALGATKPKSWDEVRNGQ